VFNRYNKNLLFLVFKYLFAIKILYNDNSATIIAPSLQNNCSVYILFIVNDIPNRAILILDNKKILRSNEVNKVIFDIFG
jgi:hypothetical protein